MGPPEQLSQAAQLQPGQHPSRARVNGSLEWPPAVHKTGQPAITIPTAFPHQGGRRSRPLAGHSPAARSPPTSATHPRLCRGPRRSRIARRSASAARISSIVSVRACSARRRFHSTPTV